jgi:shikimate kinase
VRAPSARGRESRCDLALVGVELVLPLPIALVLFAEPLVGLAFAVAPGELLQVKLFAAGVGEQLLHAAQRRRILRAATGRAVPPELVVVLALKLIEQDFQAQIVAIGAVVGRLGGIAVEALGSETVRAIRIVPPGRRLLGANEALIARLRPMLRQSPIATTVTLPEPPARGAPLRGRSNRECRRVNEEGMMKGLGFLRVRPVLPKRKSDSMKRILLTGMSGTGKSSVIAALRARGYPAVDMDEPGWSEYTPDGDWIWREDRVRELLEQEQEEVLFLSGCATNQGQFYPHFDAIVLLSAPAAVLIERLTTRTNNPYGKRPEELTEVLGYLETVEPHMLHNPLTLYHDNDVLQPSLSSHSPCVGHGAEDNSQTAEEPDETNISPPVLKTSRSGD